MPVYTMARVKLNIFFRRSGTESVSDHLLERVGGRGVKGGPTLFRSNS